MLQATCNARTCKRQNAKILLIKMDMMLMSNFFNMSLS